MPIRNRHFALVALATLVSCSDQALIAPRVSLSGALPEAVSLPDVRISEFHYDNTGTDTGEAIEISGPAGTSLAGWSLVLYNGTGGLAYNTTALGGTIPASCGTRGVVVVSYPTNGLQNGSPDGFALINASSQVVEFLSYEGSFEAVGGPADELVSTDVGVSEVGSEPVGQSLARNSAGGWSGPAANTFGTCNDSDAPPPPPPPPPSLPATRFSELHYDNFGTDAGEAIEVEGPAGTDLTGWSVVLYNGTGGAVYSTRTLSGTIPDLCSGRGVVVLTYPQDGIQNGSPDGFALINASNQVVEFLSYEGSFTGVGGAANGVLSTDIGVSESSSPVGQSLQRNAAGAWGAPATSSFGACNGTPAPPPGNTISFSGRTPSDPALPVGFQDQIFATVRDGNGATIVTAITWGSDTPLIASIDPNGVITALAAGTAVLRATAADGITTATYSLPTRVPLASLTAIYTGNAEFGEPGDADPSDDFLVHRAQYTASYNKNRGTPNWVSYDLESTHFGAEDRCDCFTFDPALPAGFTHYTTADYTGAGAFHGYGIDRGHLARSFDRTSASLDNATTFYFTNIVPQAADLNQGPWAAMESFLGDLARLQNKEVYIVTGASGSKGTIKNEGKITIPAKTWKVAVIMPRDQGLANIDDYLDLQVIAAIMPNDPGVRNINWETYKTTVDAVEALSGYDLLALLPDQVEIAVESNTRPPSAAINGPFTSTEGAAVALSGAGSSDPDGDALTYAWDFGDGTTGSGVSVTHSFPQDGSFTVKLTVTDPLGLKASTTTTATVANVAPVIAAFSGATLLPGETYSAAGSFTDPGADAWSATVDYGDGTGSGGLALSGKTFSLSHTFAAAGAFTVTVAVTDDDVTSTQTAGVTVLSQSAGIGNAAALVSGLLANGKLNPGNATSLLAKLAAAEAALGEGRGQVTAALGQLRSLLNELEALVRSGRLSSADAEALRTLVNRLVQSLKLL